MVDEGRAIPVCPEVLGGLPVPRSRYEIRDGIGEDVLSGSARVVASDGKDVTVAFIAGATRVLELAKKHGIKRAIMKSKSPSCGFGKIYDGTFAGILKRGNGVAAAMLIKNGISVTTEDT